MSEYKYAVTIFTPTYNRAKLIGRVYESLKRQTDKDFEWVIVDDGSKDNTEEVVNEFIKENSIPITYIKKENEGKHIAINLGAEKAQGELFFIVDSDDYITDDAIEIIKGDWERYGQGLGGIIYLKGYENKEVIGSDFENDYIISDKIKEIVNKEILGDKCEIVLTRLVRENKFPQYNNEKFIGEDVLWLTISRKHKYLFRKKCIYIAEYLEGGLSYSGRKLRISCPIGGMKSASMLMQSDVKFKIRMKNYLLYSTYGFFGKCKIKDLYKEVPSKLLLIVSMPFGYCLYLYWKKRFGEK